MPTTAIVHALRDTRHSQTVGNNSKMTNTTTTNRPIKHGLLGFSLTFIVIVALLTTQFIYRYSSDIFGKQFDNFVIIKMLLHGLLSVVTFALPISILVMTTIYYRQLFRNGQTKINLKGALLPSTIILVTCFMWTAFLSPINNLHMSRLLYDIRAASPGEKIEPTDLNLFRDSPMTNNFFQLGQSINSLSVQKTDARDNVDFVLSGNTKINTMKIVRAKMVGVPILLFILFFTGMFLGILNQQNKLIYLLFSIYLTVLPGIYYLQLYFEKFSKQSIVTAFQGQFIYLSILTAITGGLFVLAKRQTK